MIIKHFSDFRTATKRTTKFCWSYHTNNWISGRTWTKFVTWRPNPSDWENSNSNPLSRRCSIWCSSRCSCLTKHPRYKRSLKTCTENESLGKFHSYFNGLCILLAGYNWRRILWATIWLWCDNPHRGKFDQRKW